MHYCASIISLPRQRIAIAAIVFDRKKKQAIADQGKMGVWVDDS
jgi:hypothetical protein